MPVYSYKAKKSPKEIIEGELVAESSQEVFSRLDASGLFPIFVKEKKEASLISKKISL